MPDRLDFESARDLIAGIAPTDTWEEARARAAVDAWVPLEHGDDVRSGRRSGRWLMAVAAGLLVVLVVAAVLAADRDSVDTRPPAESPTTTECPTPTQPRGISSGGQMRNRFGAPAAIAATLVMRRGACSDEGPITIAKGTDIELEGSDPDSLGGQTLQIDVEEEDGVVSGEFRVTDIVNTVECADTATDGIVVLGGRVTTTDRDAEVAPAVGDLTALIIREGEPDAVHLYGNDVGATSCRELLESIPADMLTSGRDFVEVESGDIETGAF